MSSVQTTTREELLLGSIKNALETRNYVVSESLMPFLLPGTLIEYCPPPQILLPLPQDPPVAYRGGVPSTHSLKELLITSSVDMETTTNTTITALCTM